MEATIRIFEALAEYTIEHETGDDTAEWMDLLWQVGCAIRTLPERQTME